MEVSSELIRIVANVGAVYRRGAHATARPLASAADAWKRADDARAGARTNANKEALFNANRARVAAMRDLRRDQKALEKAREEVQWWNVFNGERRAARAVVRDSKVLAREATTARREAKKNYPLSLPALAARCHAVHAVPSALYGLMSDSLTSAVACWGSATAIALNVAVAVMASRRNGDAATTVAADATDNALHPSQEEAGLLQRLEPEEWPGVAVPRGLTDVVSAGATLTESGIQAKLTLEGQMTLDKLRGMTAQLRAALRLSEGVRLELREGSTGGHARLTLRTRTMGADIDMSGWKLGDAWAINTVTGETIPVPLGKRILFAGSSGSGKSWSARPLMAEASEHDDHRLVIIDRKYIEARNWEHRARTACELDEIRELFEELCEEGESRMKHLERGKDVIEISPSRPRITVFVDEGGELISDSKTKHPKDEEGRNDYGDIMTMARTIARKYRSSEIIMVWCTQKPSLSGEGHGLDTQVAGQMMLRLSLALSTSTESQIVFDNDALTKGWKAHELPMPGFALFRNQEKGLESVPQVMRMRAMSPADVIALPDRPIWSRSTGRASASDVAARMSLEKVSTNAAPEVSDPWATSPTVDTTVILGSDLTTTDSTPTRMSADDRDDQIMEALSANPCVRAAELAKTLGVNRNTVKRSLERMAAGGLVAQDDQGCWHPVP